METKTELREDPDLIYYTGTECYHCHEMQPVVEKVELQIGKRITKKEIWHNSLNQSEYIKAAQGKCDGIPFFFNRKTGKWICGRASEQKLKEWALGN